jgi:hypothetical protein
MRLVVTFALLLLAGCCSECDRPPPDRSRPGDVVRELREAVAAKRWDEAALCLSAEVRARNVDWPLGPGDSLLSVRLQGDEAIATIERPGLSPRELVLRREQGQWRVAGWRDLEATCR